MCGPTQDQFTHHRSTSYKKKFHKSFNQSLFQKTSILSILFFFPNPSPFFNSQTKPKSSIIMTCFLWTVPGRASLVFSVSSHRSAMVLISKISNSTKRNVANNGRERRWLPRWATFTFSAVCSVGKCTPQLGRRYDTLLRVRSTTGPRGVEGGRNEVRGGWGGGAVMARLWGETRNHWLSKDMKSFLPFKCCLYPSISLSLPLSL